MLPSTTALGIPELLEIVLEHASPQDLLLWQRVNKAWQAVIQTSPRIQERLFFRVRETCKTVFDEKLVVPNPFLELFDRGSLVVTRYGFFDNSFDGKASYPTASWRRMYFSSPAVTELNAFIVLRDKDRRELHVDCIFAYETGLRIGQLADSLKEHVARHTEYRFIFGEIYNI